MSNKRKLKVADAETAERCTSCGRRIGKLDDALRLRTGQVICPRCRQHGELPRLACGHLSLPGSFIINDDGTNTAHSCVQCSTSLSDFGNERFGLSQKGQ